MQLTVKVFIRSFCTKKPKAKGNPQGLLRVTIVVFAKFVFARTARYVVCMLKLWYHYASLGKFYKLNMWIVSGIALFESWGDFCYAACTFVLFSV